MISRTLGSSELGVFAVGLRWGSATTTAQPSASRTASPSSARP